MKTQSQIRTFPWILALVLAFFLASLVQAQENSSIVGTWKYELEDREGMAIWTDTHFIWLLSNKGRKSFQGDQPSESEKAEAFNNASADGGTYKHIGPSRITVHRLFSTVPNMPGTDFTFEYELEGDLIKYWEIQPDGTKGTMGKARRVKNQH